MAIEKILQGKFVRDCANNLAPIQHTRFIAALDSADQERLADLLDSWYDLLQNPRKVVDIFNADKHPNDKMKAYQLVRFINNAVNQINVCLVRLEKSMQPERDERGRAIAPPALTVGAKLAAALGRMNIRHEEAISRLQQKLDPDNSRNWQLRLDLIFKEKPLQAAAKSLLGNVLSGIKAVFEKARVFFFGKRLVVPNLKEPVAMDPAALEPEQKLDYRGELKHFKRGPSPSFRPISVSSSEASVSPLQDSPASHFRRVSPFAAVKVDAVKPKPAISPGVWV